MRRYDLSTLTASMLLLVCVACGKDDPEPPRPAPGNGTLRLSVECVGETPLTALVYKADGSLATQEEEPAGTAPWTWSAQLPKGEYALRVVGADPGEVRLGDTDNLGKAYAEVLPSGGDNSLLRPLESPLYLESLTGVKLADGEETPVSSRPKDIRRILRLTIDAGRGFGGAKVSGGLTGIASSIGLSDRIGQRPGTLGLEFQASATGGAGVYQSVAGILGTVLQEGSDRSNLLSLSFQTAAGERFSYQENLTAALAEAMAGSGDTLDLSLTVSPAVAIRLYTGIQTRAAVDVFDSTPLSIAVGTSPGEYTEHWMGTATAGDILLDPERYYPTDGSTLYIRSYHPAAPHVNGEVLYDLTGQEDLLLTEEQSGSLSRRFDATETPLIHKHLLTQLSFNLLIADAPAGYRVRAVVLKGLASSAKISLADGEVVPVGETTTLNIYADAEGIPVLNGLAAIPGFVLVQPEASFTIDLVLVSDNDPSRELTFNDIPITFGSPDGGVSGNAYEIEVSIQWPSDDGPDYPDTPTVPDPMEDYKVSIKATVVPWKTGHGGSADL